jgi:hypothetical protein
VSEQKADQTSGESGSLSSESPVANSSDGHSEAASASAQPPMPEATQMANVASPDLVPEQGEPAETPRADAHMSDTPKSDAPKSDAPKSDAPHTVGKLMIMSAANRSWDSPEEAAPEPESGQTSPMFGQRRLSALAAVVALALVAGVLGGALATAGLGHYAGGEATAVDTSALEASVARLDADVLALKAGAEHTSRLALNQYNKTSDRLDKIEKAQAEPAAKLARLSEAVDKLRVAPVAPVPVAAAPVAPKEVTGSIALPAAAAPVAAPKVELARLPTVEGWILRDVAHGSALIEGRQGIFEVYAGDPVPGLGRVDAIRRQDGHWVVVTSKGLIVAR